MYIYDDPKRIGYEVNETNFARIWIPLPNSILQVDNHCALNSVSNLDKVQHESLLITFFIKVIKSSEKQIIEKTLEN